MNFYRIDCKTFCQLFPNAKLFRCLKTFHDFTRQDWDIQISFQPSCLSGKSWFAVIHSRVDPASGPEHEWVILTKKILDSLDTKTHLLVSGIGKLQFDFPLYHWLKKGGQSIVISETISPCNKASFVSYKWFLEHPLVFWIVLSGPHKKPRSTTLSKKIRDQLLFAASRRIFKGMVRTGGNMAEYISQYDKEIVTDLAQTPYKYKTHVKRKITSGSNASGVASVTNECRKSKGSDEYIWHFTRSRKEPWPDQGWESYLEGLEGKDQSVPYSAFDALIQILSTQKIMASSYLIRGSYPVVCMTAVELAKIRKLMTWQKHLRRSRFDPYGIGLLKKEAIRMGVRPVIYGSSKDYRCLAEAERFLFQLSSSGRHNWAEEQEWRFKGDLDLRVVPREALKILVAAREDVEVIRDITSAGIIVF
ncbi:hypothetical protein JW979_02145 [bacterium]|nr:hypothetical protein [candidate division CSSED10-310 bacterium]